MRGHTLKGTRAVSLANIARQVLNTPALFLNIISFSPSIADDLVANDGGICHFDDNELDLIKNALVHHACTKFYEMIEENSQYLTTEVLNDYDDGVNFSNSILFIIQCIEHQSLDYQRPIRCLFQRMVDWIFRMTDIGYADTDYIIKWSLGNNINYMLEELTCQELSDMFEEYYPGKIKNLITYKTFVETYMEEKVKGGDLLSFVRIVEERWGDRFVNVADVKDEQLRRDYGIFGWDRVDEMLHIINNEWQSLEEVNPLVLWDENAVY